MQVFQSQAIHFGDINESNKSLNTRENFSAFCQDLKHKLHLIGKVWWQVKARIHRIKLTRYLNYFRYQSFYDLKVVESSICVSVLFVFCWQTCWRRCVNSIDRLQVPPRVGSKIFAKDRCETDRMTIRFSSGFYPVDPVTGRAHRSDRLRLRAPTGAKRGRQAVAPTVSVRLISSNQIDHRLTSPISSEGRNCGSRIWTFGALVLRPRRPVDGYGYGRGGRK